ncbi:hypothetical protein SNEBB_011235 [Seison nebaliae]|nr:hypothetical protein SNEBB_011235 [Seison nebaliae]
MLRSLMRRRKKFNFFQIIKSLQKRRYHKDESIIIPSFCNAFRHREKIAIIDEMNNIYKANKVKKFTYLQLIKVASYLAFKSKYFAQYQFSRVSSNSRFLHSYDVAHDIKLQPKIGILLKKDVKWISVLYAGWLKKWCIIPLSLEQPKSYIEYVIEDAGIDLVITTSEIVEEKKCKDLKCEILKLDEQFEQIHQRYEMEENLKELIDNTEMDISKEEGEELNSSKEFIERINEECTDLALTNSYNDVPNLILYTSGTTGPPKGVTHTHNSIFHQMKTQIIDWKWKDDDVILNILPLHHVHGLVNCLLTPLHVGATVCLASFQPERTWARLLTTHQQPFVTIFMAIPTIYKKLIDSHYKRMGGQKESLKRIHEICRNRIRLMVSGSSPLPDSIFHEWQRISGHRILERYGMTEIGMALGNSYEEEMRRKPGHVGLMMNGVNIRIRSTTEKNKGKLLLDLRYGDDFSKLSNKTIVGELLVKTPSMFQQYLNRPEQTKDSLTDDGYFITGDTIAWNPYEKMFSMIGRTSVDVLKSKGYKLSALDIERVLHSSPLLNDCAVVGVDDLTLGQKICAICVTNGGLSDGSWEVAKSNHHLVKKLTEHCKSRLAAYSLPNEYIFVKNLPRNTMGKINKKELVEKYYPSTKPTDNETKYISTNYFIGSDFVNECLPSKSPLINHGISIFNNRR